MDSGYANKRDPYWRRLHDPPWQCTHGNGDNCECQLPVYEGLYVTTLETDKTQRHIVVHMQQARDGGMVEFIDPMTNRIVGSCGIHWMWDHVIPIKEFMRHAPPSPQTCPPTPNQSH